MEKTKIKKLLMRFVTTGLFLCTTLTACTAAQTQTSPQLAATDIPQAGMPNPASVYCEQNGYKLEIHTAADGGQSGICIFPDGSTCDEWAYFRGGCSIAATLTPEHVATADETANAIGGYKQPGTAEEIEDWWEGIKRNPPGAQYDDFFERQDLGGVIYFGIDSIVPEVKSQIDALRDSGKIVHLYGTLFSNVPDYNGLQIQVDRIEILE